MIKDVTPTLPLSVVTAPPELTTFAQATTEESKLIVESSSIASVTMNLISLTTSEVTVPTLVLLPNSEAVPEASPEPVMEPVVNSSKIAASQSEVPSQVGSLELSSNEPSANSSQVSTPSDESAVESVEDNVNVVKPLAANARQEQGNEYEYEVYDDYEVTPEFDYNETPFDPKRKRRATEEEENIWGKLVPGACIKGCAFGFYAFSIVSSIVNCFGASGRIGNLLVNYRCVSNKDKSVTQGLILMLISLFALIPGPVLFGRIIDQTCLVWTEQCSGRRGNCQLYDQRRFRYYINLTACLLTGIGVFFDVLVWKYGKNLDLYGEREEEMLQRRPKDSRNGRRPSN